MIDEKQLETKVIAVPVKNKPEPLELAQPSPEVTRRYTSEEVVMVSQVVWGEARGCSKEEQMLVVWCICNWVDLKNTCISEEISHSRFHGYNPDNPVDSEIEEVVIDVLNLWESGEEALVYPPYATTSEYLYFRGDGQHNWFREEY